MNSSHYCFTFLHIDFIQVLHVSFQTPSSCPKILYKVLLPELVELNQTTYCFFNFYKCKTTFKTLREGKKTCYLYRTFSISASGNIADTHLPFFLQASLGLFSSSVVWLSLRFLLHSLDTEPFGSQAQTGNSQ